VLVKLALSFISMALPFVEEYRTHGIVIIPQVISQDLVKDSVEDIWNNIEELPWQPEYRARWQSLHSNMKNDYWRDVTKAEIEEVGEIYPSMGGFGALQFYQTAGQWNIRQQPKIVDIFSKLLGCEKVMVGLDRISFKYPGQGLTEFVHYDSNPFLWPEEEYESIQGIVALSDTSFFAAPGTHTMAFQKEFITKYPKTNRKDQYFIEKAHDPMELRDKVIEYKLNKGDLVIWSNRLLHEARINKRNNVRYAHFITYLPYGRPPPTVVKAYQAQKVDYVKDRLESYRTGKTPLCYPSGTKIELFSKQVFMYFPNKLNEFCARFLDEASEERTYQSGKKQGQKVRVPINYSPKDLGNYSPPPLTDLGKQLLG